jgi:hypothetical protein
MGDLLQVLLFPSPIPVPQRIPQNIPHANLRFGQGHEIKASRSRVPHPIERSLDDFQDRLDEPRGFEFGDAKTVSGGAAEVVFGEGHGPLLRREGGLLGGGFSRFLMPKVFIIVNPSCLGI